MRPAHAQPLVAALVIAAPHLLGGVFAWGTCALAACACVALGVALRATRLDERRSARDVEPIAGLLALMLAVTVAQAVPLPAAIAAWLAPAALANASSTALGLASQIPQAVPFSLDPGGTHERVLFGLALFAAFCAGRMETETTRRTQLLAAVAASVILIAVSNVLHRAFGATSVYGIYTPESAAGRGPLLNPNNLAGFLALGFPICLGLAMQTGQGVRGLWAVSAAVVAATNLLAGSRGGTAVLVGGGLLFGALFLLRSPGLNRFTNRHGHNGSPASGQREARGRIAGAAVILVSIGMAVVLAELAADDFIDRNYQDLTKLDVYRAEWRLLFDEPRTTWLGVGRGAFSAAFAPVSLWFSRAREAESLPLQYAIEFGLPLAALLLGGAGMRLFAAFWRWRSPAQLGGLVGVLAITLQNLFDFSLELSGIAVPAAVCLAAALPNTRQPAEGWRRLASLRRVSLYGLIPCFGLLLAFSPSAVSNDRALAERELKRHIANHDSGTFWARFREVVPAHPGEPSFALMAAAQRVRERHPDAAFWLRRAMKLAPASALPHLWAARSLGMRRQWDAALDELRIAAQLDPAKTLNGLCPWIGKAPMAQTVLRIAPREGKGRLAVLDAGARCLAAFPAEAEKVDGILLAANPTHLPARLRQAQRDLGARQWDLALDQAHKIARDAPTLAEARIVEANALIGQGQAREAVARLLAALPNTDDRGAILTALAFAQTSARDADGMRRSVEQLRMAGAGNAQKLAAAAARLSEYEALLGNTARALKAAREAYALSPHPNLLASAAHLASKLGQVDFALSAWEQLCAEQPNNTAYCSFRDAILAPRKQTP